MHSCNYPTLGRSQGQKIGHNLPVAVMPVRQRSLPPVLGQRYANGGHLYATGHDPCTNAQTSVVAATRPPAARALPPVPPLLHHLCSSTSNETSGGWGPMMQGRERGELPPMHRRRPYTPTWHLQRPPITGTAHIPYVKHIPSASTINSRMGQMAPPPYQLMPPPPQPSRAQQLLVLTPLEQSMRITTSEAEAGNMATTMGQELLNRMPPPRPSPYQYMPPPQLPRTPDQLLMPPPQRLPTPYWAQSLNGRGNGQVWGAPGLMSITEKWQICRARMIKMLGLLLLIA